jgi:hypothetical protein
LFHAHKAIEEAKWGLKTDGDEQGAGSRLLAIAKRALEEGQTDLAHQASKRGEESEDSKGKEESVEDNVPPKKLHSDK